MPASIRDVAEKAGVSIGTVSRAFNGYRDISVSTRERILRVAKELGYIPNLSAKILSSKKVANIAMVFSGLLGEKAAASELEMLLIKGAYEYASKHKLEIATYVIDKHFQKTKSYEQFCHEHSLAGALLFGLKTTDVYCERLPESRLPCVTVDVVIKGENLGSVSTDNIEAFQALTQHLIDCGHRKFILVHGRKNTMVSDERLAGAYQALRENGIFLTRDEVIYSNFEEDKAYFGVRTYLEKNPNTDVTAFLCMSDLTAIGAMRAIRDLGYRIPEDFSVAGYDAIYAGKCTYPALTTVDQHTKEKGYQAARLLHQMMQQKEVQRHIVLPYSIVYGSSVRKV